MSMNTVIVDSTVVSSSIVPLTQKPLPAATDALVRRPSYPVEKVRRMYERHLVLPSKIWDEIETVSFTAHPQAQLILLAFELQSLYPLLPAYESCTRLAPMEAEITLNMIQLLRIVTLAKKKNILQ